MFDWLRSKPLKPEETKAYQLGQALAQRLEKSFDAYKEHRFDPILQRYVDIFRQALQKAIKSEEKPPYYSVREEGNIFATELATLKRQMREEMSVAVADWLAEYPPDIRADCEQLTHAWIDRLCQSAGEATLKIFDDYKVVLDDADAAWRASHPELVAQFPIL